MYIKDDSLFKGKVKVILPGEFYVTKKNEVIYTVLGSCISVCLFDEIHGISGMNHFMLPKKLSNNYTNEYTLRYGNTSMEIMINEFLHMGGERKNLKAKIFGGANILISNTTYSSVGEKNIGFISTFLKTEGIQILKQDVGLEHGRKLYFRTNDNSVFVKKIQITAVNERDIKAKKIDHNGEITLFK